MPNPSPRYNEADAQPRRAMESFLKSLSQVSFFFFAVLGILHIGVSSLTAQGVVTTETRVLFYVLDLPFLLAALIYASTRLSLTLGKIFDNHKWPLILCSVLASVVFIGALVLNFFIPDVRL